MDRRTVLQSLIAAVSLASVHSQSNVDGKNEGFLVHFDQNRNRAVLSSDRGRDEYAHFLVSGKDTNGALCITGPQRSPSDVMRLNSVGPNPTSQTHRSGNVPLHIHYAQDEYWYTFSGEGLVQVGDQRFHAKAGDLVMGPRGVPHAPHGLGHWGLVTIWQPAGTMEEFFHELAEMERKNGGKLPPQDEFAALFKRHGMEIVGPPIQA